MIRVGVSIMYHPRRADRVPPLVRDCAPLEAAPVRDPDPDGAPSPLRTAKRAWARIQDGVTHHMVLQDDIALAPGFAEQVHEAVARHPEDGVSFYSHWNSPQNSYLVRRAAVAGASYAPLSLTEWTPCQGFVLPVDRARELAAYLAEIPDEVQDDDEMVAVFCRKQGIPVVATVPHLVDHGVDETIVGHRGELRATVFAPGEPAPAAHWTGRTAADPGPYTVELLESRCGLRMVDRDPVEHKFAWHWYDACGLAGVDPRAVLDAAGPHIGGLPDALVPVAAEVWAAGHLLGADAAGHPPVPPGGGPFTRHAIGSWVDSGLAEPDRALLGGTGRDVLVALGVAAVRHGLAHPGGRDAR
ncbi:hypothetical protein ACQEU6_44175 [Spirillospora sp. CA-108201]